MISVVEKPYNMNHTMPYRQAGLIFRDEVIKEHGLTIDKAAELLKVMRPALSNVLNGHADISPEMSLRISKVFGGTAEIWMNLQTAYNLDQLRSKVDALDLHLYKADS